MPLAKQPSASAGTGNRILAALPRTEFEHLRRSLQPLHFDARDVIYRTGAPMAYVYFPSSGMFSRIIIMEGGSCSDVGVVGNDGMVGVAAYLGAEQSPYEVICQIEGDVWRMPVRAFRTHLQGGSRLALLMQRFAQATLIQSCRAAACSKLHCVRERLANWLLTAQDCVGSERFALTQDLLAMMLGVRRASVTTVANMLQKADLIRYHRGRITILDRAGLERASCECYRAIRDQTHSLLAGPGAL
jgi:CRP-like cAMP-binding protein